MMVKQQEEKLQEKERELIKREQEVNEKLARMVSLNTQSPSNMLLINIIIISIVYKYILNCFHRLAWKIPMFLQL